MGKRDKPPAEVWAFEDNIHAAIEPKASHLLFETVIHKIGHLFIASSFAQRSTLNIILFLVLFCFQGEELEQCATCLFTEKSTPIEHYEDRFGLGKKHFSEGGEKGNVSCHRRN